MSEIVNEVKQLFYEVNNMKRKQSHSIGDGEYEVVYKHWFNDEVKVFTGVCENFNPSGKSAFWNNEKGQMLIIEYKDIIGLYPRRN